MKICRTLSVLTALVSTPALLVYAGPAMAQSNDDVMASAATVEDANAGPLHTVTFITPDLDGLRALYEAGMGLTVTGPLEISPGQRATEQYLWGMPPGLGYEVYLMHRPSVPGTVQMRVLVTEEATPAMRDSWNRQQLGPYGMGFPTLDVDAWDEHLLGLGFERAVPEVEEFQVSAPNGETYPVREAPFFGPGYLRIIAIGRGGGRPQVGVFDPDTGRGGPVYATQIVEDADAMIRFFTTVLDMELRSDRTWAEYEVPFRFALIHSKGSQTGHTPLVEYAREFNVPGLAAPRPPNRGMAIWSYKVKDLDAILARAEAAEYPVHKGPADFDSLLFGTVRAATFLAPNGFMIEVFEAR
jgi:catechol 2,3-dioxygenase-like lactoylglutathione lyase family enzyme